MDTRLAKYELMVILMPDMGESKTAEELQEVREQITATGGEILDEDLWGVRKLAYQIKKQENGYYAVFNFTFDTSKVHELETSLILNPQVIRQLVLRISDSYTLKKLADYEEQWAKDDLESKQKEDAEQERKDELKKPVRKVEKPLKKEEKVVEVKEEKEEEKPKKETKKIKEEVKEEKEEEEEKPKKETKKKKEEETDSRSKLDEFDEKLRSLINDPDITL
ncbi:30S ribosomal protein S6 [Candidatus Gracilibacteria bacterium]|jgi:small subunit ribosomal protein S6|nr:30S ribosomal protein S6 [Candidatus Gracilibacteria bacterium]